MVRITRGVARVASIGVAVAALALAAGCADDGNSLCADAASHVLACTGSSAAGIATKCATTAASGVLKEDCDDVRASIDGGKTDGTWDDAEGYLCQALEIPDYCPGD